MNIAVIGLGLMGGSFALDIKVPFPRSVIYGIDNSFENLIKAKEKLEKADELARETEKILKTAEKQARNVESFTKKMESYLRKVQRLTLKTILTYM